MTRPIVNITFSLILLIFLGACSYKRPHIIIDHGSAEPAGHISKHGKHLKLIGTAITVGAPIPATHLVDAQTIKSINLKEDKGAVLFLSVVPSIDTKVCEAQTHYLGEEGDKLPASIKRITISRDTPFAQMRFADQAQLTDIQFLSDYKTGAFGGATGLLIDNVMLLARAVIIVDQQGIIRYMQVVPEITKLPDMGKAFKKAAELAQNP